MKNVVFTIVGIIVVVYFGLRIADGPTWPPIDDRKVYESTEGCRYSAEGRFIYPDSGDEIYVPGLGYARMDTEKWRCKNVDEYPADFRDF